MPKLSEVYDRGFVAGLQAAGRHVGGLVAVCEANYIKLNHWQIGQAFNLCIQHYESVRDRTGGFLKFNYDTKEVEWYDGKNL